MKTCRVCIKQFHVGYKGYCSIDCYLETLQNKLDECFRNDTSHTKLLTTLVWFSGSKLFTFEIKSRILFFSESYFSWFFTKSLIATAMVCASRFSLLFRIVWSRISFDDSNWNLVWFTSTSNICFLDFNHYYYFRLLSFFSYWTFFGKL